MLYLSFPFCLMVAADQVCILYPTQQLCSEDTTSSPRNANSEDALPSLQQLKSNFKIRDLPVRVSSGAWQHTPTLRQRFPARCQTHECASMVLLTLKNVYTCIYTCIYIYTLYYWYYLCSLIPTLFSCQTGLQGSDSRSSAWNDLLPDVHETGRSYQAHWHRKCWPVHAC
jgi:hypothetical protein